jgi:hypothetical protein
MFDLLFTDEALCIFNELKKKAEKKSSKQSSKNSPVVGLFNQVKKTVKAPRSRATGHLLDSSTYFQKSSC